MYITCPKCKTHFVIKPGQLGKNGRKAKCAKCKFIWFAQAEEEVKNESVSVKPEIISGNKSAAPYEESTWLPAVVYSNQKKHGSFCVYQWILGAMVILALLFTEVIDHGYFGYNNKVIIDNINITKEADDHTLVHYTIINNGDYEMDLPVIRFRFFDENHNIIHRILIENNVVKLSPGQSARLKREFKITSFNSVDVTAGTKLDFALSY